MGAQVPTWIAAIGVAVGAFITALGTVWSKRTSTPAETQEQLNNSFRLYMESTDKKLKILQEEHQTCSNRFELLKSYVARLIRLLRKAGIPIPIMDEALLLEFRDHNGHDTTS